MAIPFDKGYVLAVTHRHMLKSVQLSIAKTVERIPEFEGDSAKSTELLSTLSELKRIEADIKAQLPVEGA